MREGLGHHFEKREKASFFLEDDVRGMPELVIAEPSEAMRRKILAAMHAEAGSEAARLRDASEATLDAQGDDEIIIKFGSSKPDAEAFVNYLKRTIH
jgi:hypothetical protein